MLGKFKAMLHEKVLAFCHLSDLDVTISSLNDGEAILSIIICIEHKTSQTIGAL